MSDYSKENLSPRVNILEIGPRVLPSTEFFNQYPDANVVLVANESFTPYRQHLPVNATTVEADVIDYLASDHASIPPEGFDFILSASEAKRLKNFLTTKLQVAGFTVTESQESIKSRLAQTGSFHLRATKPSPPANTLIPAKQIIFNTVQINTGDNTRGWSKYFKLTK